MNEAHLELDLRTLPPQLRHGKVFDAFDRLRPGEALVLVNDHDPMPLLQQFKFVRPGQAESEYLERGPEAWRVRIARKAPAAREATGGAGANAQAASVTEYLERDHRRLDAMLPGVEQLARTGAYRDASDRFAEFAGGLDRHIVAEEDVLFPAFEAATGMSSGPTDVMRWEHARIRESMARIAAALRAEDPAAFEGGLGDLTGTLAAHNLKEERMLYPMADRAAGGDRERAELVERLRAV